MKNKITINDVAAYTGVSPSTVSHALSGRRKISDKVRGRIFDAVEKLNYRPSYTAQVLSSKRTMLVGALVSDCGNAASGMLFEALNAELDRHSYKMVLGISGTSHERGMELLKAFSSGLVDGIINMMYQIDTNEAKVICSPVPVVTYLRQDQAPIYIDFESSIMTGLEYLWSMGHRRIGFITSHSRVYNSVDPCLSGFKHFLSLKGAEFDPLLVMEGNNTSENGGAIAERLYRQGVSAIFAGNDQMATGVYQWAMMNGVKIPEDLSVLGFDDSPLATAVCPPLTTLQMPVAEIARHTVESLVARIEGLAETAQTRVVCPTLIIRKSICTAKQST
ncbi:MAG: LacI family DNA-binding transcriptional regulator [Victivallales bacterium]|nr:LacI family DNA-binding transcriptional regulator [Victivallales bacterium]